MWTKKPIIVLIVWWCFCAAAIQPAPAQQVQLAPLPVGVALTARRFPLGLPMSLSPDNKLVAYMLQDASRRQVTNDANTYTQTGIPVGLVGWDIWITNVETGQSTNLTRGANNWSPAWSPNGQYLGFYSDRAGTANLWVWEKSSGKIRRVSSAIIHPLTVVICWTPDSKKVVTKILPENKRVADLIKPTASQERSEPTKGSHSTVTVYRSPSSANKSEIAAARQKADENAPWSLTPYFADFALIDMPRGEVRRLTRGDKPRWYQLSPDGSSIAYSNVTGFAAAASQQMLYDLVIVSLTLGTSRTIASNLTLNYNGDLFSWSPDGKQLSYIATDAQGKGDCFIVPAGPGEPHNLTKSTHPPFIGAPLWHSSGRLSLVTANAVWSTPTSAADATEIAKVTNRQIKGAVQLQQGGRVWSPDGHSMIVITQDDQTKRSGFYKVDLTTGRTGLIVEENKYYSVPYTYTMIVSKNEQRLVYIAEDSQHNSDLWMADADFHSPKRVTDINSEFGRYVMGESRLIQWETAEGQQLQGALLLPAGYKQGVRYPLIVYPYGGSFRSNEVNRFGFSLYGVDNMQLLATRGYAVLLPDAPTHLGTPMQDIMKTVMPGIDKVIELGVADPDRLGVMGHSNGGYNTLSLIVQTTRFKAAVMRAGLGNLTGTYGELGDNGTAYALAIIEGMIMGGSPWELREKYVENSPFFYLDKVQTPLLIVHGGADPYVRPTSADAVFVGLRRLGKKVQYARYEGESHSESQWSYANQEDYLNRIIGWFDKWLKEPS